MNIGGFLITSLLLPLFSISFYLLLIELNTIKFDLFTTFDSLYQSHLNNYIRNLFNDAPRWKTQQQIHHVPPPFI